MIKFRLNFIFKCFKEFLSFGNMLFNIDGLEIMRWKCFSYKGEVCFNMELKYSRFNIILLNFFKLYLFLYSFFFLMVI